MTYDILLFTSALYVWAVYPFDVLMINIPIGAVCLLLVVYLAVDLDSGPSLTIFHQESPCSISKKKSKTSKNLKAECVSGDCGPLDIMIPDNFDRGCLSAWLVVDSDSTYCLLQNSIRNS